MGNLKEVFDWEDDFDFDGEYDDYDIYEDYYYHSDRDELNEMDTTKHNG